VGPASRSTRATADRDLRGDHRQRAGAAAHRHRRAAARGQRGPDRRGRRDPAPRTGGHGALLENEEATQEVFDHGWLRTGDLGSLDADGYLTISGRAKEIIVTAGGKNVVPGPIEEELRANPLVAQAMVVGDGRPFVAALITLDADGVRRWAEEAGRGEVDPHDLEQDEALRVEIQQVVDAANQAVSRAEGVRRFELLADDFTEEAGELTATLKMRRHIIEQTRADAMRTIYG
jgi:long-chain acyl-CoA synthetase